MGMSLLPYFSKEKTFDGVAGGPDVWISPYVKQHICPGKGGRRAFFYGLFFAMYVETGSIGCYIGRIIGGKRKNEGRYNEGVKSGAIHQDSETKKTQITAL